MESWLQQLIMVDTSQVSEPGEARRLQALHYINLASAVSILLYGFLYLLIDPQDLYLMSAATLLIVPFFGVTTWLTRRGYVQAARLLLMASVFIATFTVTGIFLGSAAGLHYYLIFFAMVPILLWPYRQGGYILAFSLLNLVGFAYVEFFFQPWPGLTVSLAHSAVLFLRFTTLISAYLTMALILGMEQYRQDLEEKALVQQNARLEEMAERLRLLSNTDLLTSLLNRRALLEWATKEVQYPSYCVIICDIDHFKAVNDTYGHACGDFVLQELAKILRQCVRSHDVVARWGGEEFCILLPGTTPAGAAALAERIRVVVTGTRFPWNEAQISLTLTLGVAKWAPPDDFDGVLRKADAALYAGKAEGRNCVVLYSGE